MAARSTAARASSRGLAPTLRLAARPRAARRGLHSAQPRVQLRQLAGVDRVGGLGTRVASRADVFGVGYDARVHLLLQVGVALDEARTESVADSEQVMEDEHLAVGGGTRTDADDRYLDVGHQLLGDRAGYRLEDEREAPHLLQ